MSDLYLKLMRLTYSCLRDGNRMGDLNYRVDLNMQDGGNRSHDEHWDQVM